MKKFWLAIGIGVLFRLLLTPLVINGDLVTQAEWGKWMYEHGTVGVYSWNRWLNEWPNHPPLITAIYFLAYKIHSFLMMVFADIGNFIALNRLAPTKFLWFYDFIKWFGTAKYKDGVTMWGVVIVVKLIMIVADSLVATMIFYLCKKAKVPWEKFVFSYLFLPFSWYLSALWGQSDQLAALFLTASFLLIMERWAWLSPVLLAVAINLKPTGLILIPLFLAIWWKQKQKGSSLLIGCVVAILVSAVTLSWYTEGSYINFVVQDLWKRLFWSKGHFTTVSAFNFWYIFHDKGLVVETSKYMSLGAVGWGYLVFGVLNLISISLIKLKKVDSVFASMFITAFGGWLFLTNMYERYAFAGILAILFFSIYKNKYFRYFVILSLIYLLNLYNGWWFPEKISWLKNIFLWNDRLITKVLSLGNLIIYLWILKMMAKDYGFRVGIFSRSV